MAQAHTLILVKPDAINRNLIGQILSRFEAAGLTITRLSLRNPDRGRIRRHYHEHRSEPYYNRLITYLADSPVVAAVLTGVTPVATARSTVGATDPANASPGSIRGDLGSDSMQAADQENRAVRNLVHASDSPEAAAREIALWFPTDAE